jgi:hypothetical protein
MIGPGVGPHRDHAIDGGEDRRRHLARMHGDEQHALDGAGNTGGAPLHGSA